MYVLVSLSASCGAAAETAAPYVSGVMRAVAAARATRRRFRQGVGDVTGGPSLLSRDRGRRTTGSPRGAGPAHELVWWEPPCRGPAICQGSGLPHMTRARLPGGRRALADLRRVPSGQLSAGAPVVDRKSTRLNSSH